MTPAVSPDPSLEEVYEQAALEYLHSLPVEHFMESTDHAHQRKITLVSLDLVRAARPEVQCFSELLIQWPTPGGPRRFGRVCPDNMVVVHPAPIRAKHSYALATQPVGPLVVMEYVSDTDPDKDYDDAFLKYEGAVRVPYYLLYDPRVPDVTVFRLGGGRYAPTAPNRAGRLPIPELELEVGLLDGWARYWFRGELLPLPADLLRDRDAERAGRRAAERQAATAERQAATAERRAAAAERQVAAAEEQAVEAEEQAVEAEEQLAAERDARAAAEEQSAAARRLAAAAAAQAAAERDARAAAEEQAAAARGQATAAAEQAAAERAARTAAENLAAEANERAGAERDARQALAAEIARLRDELARASRPPAGPAAGP